MRQSILAAVAALLSIPTTWATAPEATPDPAGGTAASAAREVVRLADIEVKADGSQVELPQPFAGGQVATGGRVGLFGNLDMMDTPFNSTSYTAELIKNQQARSMADVVQNDPAVRVARGFGNFQELYFIRGFPVFSDDMAYNGLYGVLPRQYTAAEFLERVEVFRGANSFLNGAAPGGSGIGGLINLVPKRAPDEGLNRVTLGYENAAQRYAAADVARRFGRDGAYGLRVNAVRRDGETAIAGEDRELGVVAIGTDYRGERLRLSADLGWQDYRLDAPRPSVTPGDGIPRPPDASGNFAQPWTFSTEEDLFGTLRGEFDLGATTRIWAAAGLRNGEESNVLANPRSDADGQTSSNRFDNTREDRVTTSEIGLRTEFETGAVGHRLTLSASVLRLDSKNAFAFYLTPFANDLYEPQPVEPSSGPVFAGGDLRAPRTTTLTRTASVALADTLALLDRRVLVTLGARHQTIEQYGYDFNTGEETSAYDESTVTPVFAIVGKPSAAVSLYANYIESLAQGETVPATIGGEPVENAGEVFEPFRSKQYEIGAKYDGGTLGLTAALFRTAQPSTRFDGRRVNLDGEQRHVGVELTAFGEPLPGVRVLGGATWLDAELTRTEGGANDGNTPIGVPEWQANLGAEWDLPMVTGLTLESRIVYTGEQAAAEDNRLHLPSWTRIDMGVRHTRRIGALDTTVRARLDNLADRDYWASTGGFPGANYLVLAPPRTFTVSLSVDF